MSIFFDRFSFLCKENGETPNSLGKKLGIPSGSITAWKKGTIPRSKTLDEIADFFGTTVDYLLGRTDDAENSGSEEKLKEHISDEEKTIGSASRHKRKLHSVARLESSDITPEMDKNIAEYIDFLIKKRDEG